MQPALSKVSDSLENSHHHKPCTHCVLSFSSLFFVSLPCLGLGLGGREAAETTQTLYFSVETRRRLTAVFFFCFGSCFFFFFSLTCLAPLHQTAHSVTLSCPIPNLGPVRPGPRPWLLLHAVDLMGQPGVRLVFCPLPLVCRTPRTPLCSDPIWSAAAAIHCVWRPDMAIVKAEFGSGSGPGPFGCVLKERGHTRPERHAHAESHPRERASISSTSRGNQGNRLNPRSYPDYEAHLRKPCCCFLLMLQLLLLLLLTAQGIHGSLEGACTPAGASVPRCTGCNSLGRWLQRYVGPVEVLYPARA